MTIFQKVITLANPTREFGFMRSLGVHINTLRTRRSDWLILGCLFVFLFLLIHLTTSNTTFNKRRGRKTHLVRKERDQHEVDALVMKDYDQKKLVYM